MAWLFASGHAVDIVLAFILLEAVFLKLRGWNLRDLALMLLPAVLILLGLRAALTGAAWWWIALPLILSLPVHLTDMLRRDRTQRKARKP